MKGRAPKKTPSEKAVADDDLWRLVSAVPKPVSYWVGRSVHSGFAPDNILVFPYLLKPIPAKENYGNYHPRFVLDILLGHPGILHLGDADHLLEAGECALVFPHQFHLGRTVDSNPPPSGSPGWAVITFDLRDSGPLECLRDAPRQLRVEDKALLREVIQSYLANESALDLAFYLGRLLLSLRTAPEIPAGRRNLPSPESGHDAFLEKINQSLKLHASPADLAKAMGLSEARLKNQFRKCFGSSLGDYIRRNRLSKAVRMLQLADGNITEISDRLGFSSVHAFSRMFKAVYGLPPKQYEKLLR